MKLISGGGERDRMSLGGRISEEAFGMEDGENTRGRYPQVTTRREDLIAFVADSD